MMKVRIVINKNKTVVSRDAVVESGSGELAAIGEPVDCDGARSSMNGRASFLPAAEANLQK